MKLIVKNFILPLILSLLPILLLIPSISEEQAELDKITYKELIQVSDSVVSKIRDASSVKYWAYKISKEFKESIQKELYKILIYKKNINQQNSKNTKNLHSNTNTNEKIILQQDIKFIFEKMYKKINKLGLFRTKLWCFYIADHDKFRQNLNLSLVESKLFEKEYKSTITKLFQQLVLNHYYDTAISIKGIQTIFSNSFTNELLESKVLGIPIPVIYKNNYYYFVWNVIELNKEAYTGFILLLENKYHAKNLPLQTLIKFWHKICPKYTLGAAFFLYPGPKISYLPYKIIHPNLHKKQILENISKVVKQFKWSKALYTLSEIQLLNDEISQNNSFNNSYNNTKLYSNHKLKDLLAKFNIPYNDIDSIIKSENHYFRIFTLAENNPYFGVLCFNYSHNQINQLKRLFIILLVFWFIGWLVYIVLNLIYQDSYRLTTGIQITAWILCLMAYPCILLISSQHKLINNLQVKAIEETVEKLKDRLLSLESISNKQIQKKASKINSILTSKSVVEKLISARINNDLNNKALAFLLDKLNKTGIQPEMLAIVGTSSYLLATYTTGLSLEQINQFKASIQEVGNIFINHNSLEPLPIITKYSYSTIFSGDLNSDYRNPGTVKIATIGTKRLCRLHNFIYFNRKILLYVVVIWQPDKKFPLILQKIIRNLHAKHGIETAVFYKKNYDIQVIAGAGRITTFYNQIKASIQRPYHIIEPNGEFIQYIYPSNVLKNYIFCTKDSLANARKNIEKEKFWFWWISLFGLTLLLIFSGLSIYYWLGVTIKDLNLAIKELGSGNFSVRVISSSNDEFGVAAKAFDNMASDLEQKKLISHFVADNLVNELKLETQSLSFYNFKNKVKERIILFTDIRNFTTFTESNSPEVIFQTLNRHFKEITESIKMYGGHIERFLGDAVQAFFEIDPAQNSKELVVVKALLAALEIINRWQIIQKEREKDKLFNYNIGVGIAIGDTISGIIGDPSLRQDLLILGEPIYTANYMESLSKKLNKTSIVVTDEIKNLSQKYFKFEKISNNPLAWELIPIFQYNTSLYNLIQSTTPDQLLNQDLSFNHKISSSNSKIIYYGKTGQKAFKISSLAFWAVSSLIMILSINSWNITLKSTNKLLNTYESKQILHEIQECYDPFNQTTLLYNKKLEMLDYKINELLNRGKLCINKDFSKIVNFYQKNIAKLCKKVQNAKYFIIKPGKLYLAENENIFKAFIAELYSKALPNMLKLSKSYKIFIDKYKLFDNKVSIKPSFYDQQIIYSNKAANQNSPISNWELIFLIWIFETNLMHNKNYFTVGLPEACLSAIFTKKEPHQFRTLFTTALNNFSKFVLSDNKYIFYWHPVGLFRNDKLVNCLFHIVVLLPQEYFSFDTALKNTSKRFSLDKTFVKLTQITGHGKLTQNTKTSDKKISFQTKSKLYLNKENFIHIVDNRIIGNNKIHIEIIKKVKQYIQKPKTLNLFKGIIIFWTFLGFIFLIFHKNISSWLFINLNLRHKIIFAFSVFLLPTVIVTISFLERNLIIEHLVSKFKQESLLEEELRRAESAYEILQNWRSRIAIGILENSINKKIKSLFEKFSKQKNNKLQISVETLEKLYAKFIRYCSIPVGLVFDGGLISNSSLSFIDIDMTEDPNTLLAKLALPTLYQINPGIKPTKLISNPRDSKEEYITEEVLNITKYLLPPDWLPELLNLPWIDCKMEIGNTILQLFKAFVPISSNQPLVLFMTVWDYRWIVTVLADIWKQTNHHVYYEYQIYLPNTPSITIPYPYLLINTAVLPLKSKDVLCLRFTEYFKIQNADISALLNLADSSKQALSKISYNSYLKPSSSDFTTSSKKITKSYFEQEEMVLGFVRTSAIASRFFFYISSPIGKIWKSQIKDKIIKATFVSFIFAFSMILATIISLRFTKPLELFSNACIKVQNGDYKQSLFFNLGNELDELAGSFNNLCKDLEEGKLIKTFISDSLKSLIKKQDLFQQAKKGEIKNVTVMFVGVESVLNQGLINISEGFEKLNKILIDTSFVIKKYNGDIDKFIGEKVLAVFDHSSFNNSQEAMLSSIKASLEVWTMLNQVNLQSGFNFGVGIVTGKVLAGILGSELVRLEYTVLGDTVNLASRLCDLALKSHKNSILLDSITASNVYSNYKSLPLGEAKIKGKLHEVMVYKLELT